MLTLRRPGGPHAVRTEEARLVAPSRRVAPLLTYLHFDHHVSYKRRLMSFWVYMIQCADQSYNVGHSARDRVALSLRYSPRTPETNAPVPGLPNGQTPPLP